MKNRTILITGASRGIGRAIALRCARDGANVVIAAKTSDPHPKLEGTIHSVAKEVEALGGKALAYQVDVRNEDEVKALIAATEKKFGGLDALVNNAGAIHLAAIEDTPMKRYDLMHQINARAVFLCSQAALPLLKKSNRPHILNLSPPVSLDPKWLTGHVAYTVSKYGMTLYTLGMAEELKKIGISVNSLWPRAGVATAATEMLMGKDAMKHMRHAEIMSDAAHAILTTEKVKLTGQALIDEDFLRTRGVTDFEKYAVEPGAELVVDLYVEGDESSPKLHKK